MKSSNIYYHVMLRWLYDMLYGLAIYVNMASCIPGIFYLENSVLSIACDAIANNNILN